MRSIRPIPRSALPDVMTVRTPLPDGTFDEPQIIANVRFERTQKVSDDDHRSADAGGGTVFVDAVNSIGAFEVAAGSRVAVGGRSMYVAESHACCDLFEREARMEDEERGTVTVAVLVVRDVEAIAEADAQACERWIRAYGWELVAENGSWRICGLDTTMPSFKERDGSGRFVYEFDVRLTVVRSL